MTYKRSTSRVRTPAGGFAMTDEEYNRKWFERFRARTVVNERGCWVWTGPTNAKGYPNHAHRRHPNQAHRTAYILTHGLAKLQTHQFVCHTCDERRCWNPAHLFLGDAKTNNRDCGNKGRHHNSVKLTCKRGHPFSFENTYLKVTPTTVMRACKTCQRENQLRRYHANREEHSRRNREYRQRRKEREAAQNV